MTPRRVLFLLGAGIVIVAFAIWLSSRRHLERATSAGALVGTLRAARIAAWRIAVLS